ncbi:DUF3048 domain-containing protein [Isoptericola sp. S6320L]|uniref:DUF3048 domain-containing protein n=1 Tax=Isoptericola sp. S6320L TaxID=2926411 RepID=UPI001FF65561|nr:DUF3048 domain-containing protein [Isoptericola sp. S6320L]MCK0118800.1 DUF3048 domain-containing protein [Isoptericola sp. S6320L]
MTVRFARRAAPGALALIAVLVTACGGDPEPAPTTTVPAPVEAQKTAPPTPDAPIVWPLTGVETDEVAARPALAVKIENDPVVRPQTGLDAADMVWEQVIEGGVTRFVAVYHSRVPDAVEPVRSVRPMDPAIVAPLDGILAYSGAQQPFIDDVRAAGTQSVIMDAGDPGFRRDPGAAAPHNVIGDPQAFLARADGERTAPPPAQFAFAAEGRSTAVADGAERSSLDVHLSPRQTAGWDWDADAGAWLRREGADPSMAASGERHAAANVVVLEVEVVDTSFKDPAGAPVPETQLVGSGTAFVASGGRVLEAEWSKESVRDPVELVAGGEPVELEPGATWVELLPTSGGLDVNP